MISREIVGAGYFFTHFLAQRIEEGEDLDISDGSTSLLDNPLGESCQNSTRRCLSAKTCNTYFLFFHPSTMHTYFSILRSCLDKYSKKQGREYTCPTDRIQVSAARMFPDKALERRVLSLGVACTNINMGCTWRGELRGLDGHLGECGYATVVCRLCGVRVLEGVAEDHEVNQCGHRVLSCGLCQVGWGLGC